MTTCFKFLGGFASGLLDHVARVAAWAIVTMIIASLFGLTPSWSLLALVALSNVAGAAVYAWSEP